MLCKQILQRAVVVAQLVDMSRPIPEVRGSISGIGKNFKLNIYCQLYSWKTKIKKKRPGIAHLIFQHFAKYFVEIKGWLRSFLDSASVTIVSKQQFNNLGKNITIVIHFCKGYVA